MRKQFDGLAALASHVLKCDVMSGHVFVFCNRRRDRIKLLFWDRSGFWLLAKRLEKGTFAWPQTADSPAHEATVRELMCILEGIEIKHYLNSESIKVCPGPRNICRRFI